MIRIAAREQGRSTDLAGPIDINQASAEQLSRVPGVGPRTAERLLIIRQARRLRLRDLQRLHVGLSRVKPYIIAADHRPAPFAGDSPVEPRQTRERRQLPLF